MTPQRTDARRRLLDLATSVGPLLLLSLLAVVVVALHVRDDRLLSPIDEFQHIDYIVQASSGHIPRVGEDAGIVAQREAACRSIEAAYTPPPCGDGPYAPTRFPQDGMQTAAVDPPVYYAITGVAARAIQRLAGLSSVVTAGRLVSAGWLVSAIVMCWAAMGELGVRRASRAAALVLMTVAPAVVLPAVTITNDIAVLTAGAALLLGVLLWEHRRLPLWGLMGITVVALLCKATVLAGLGLVVGYLLIRAIAPGDEGDARAARWRHLRAAAGVAAAGVGATAAWLLAVHLRTLRGAVPSPSARSFHVDSFRLDDVFANLTATFSPFDRAGILIPMRDPKVLAVAALIGPLVIAAAFAASLRVIPEIRVQALGLATLGAMLAFGPFLAVVNYFNDHTSIPIPSRYGLAVAPALVALTGVVIDRSVVRYGVWALAALAGSLTVGRLVMAGG